jgi:hypothetical protein
MMLSLNRTTAAWCFERVQSQEAGCGSNASLVFHRMAAVRPVPTAPLIERFQCKSRLSSHGSADSPTPEQDCWSQFQCKSRLSSHGSRWSSRGGKPISSLTSAEGNYAMQNRSQELPPQAQSIRRRCFHPLIRLIQLAGTQPDRHHRSGQIRKLDGS